MFTLDTKEYVLKHLGFCTIKKAWECQMHDTNFKLVCQGTSPQDAIDKWIITRNRYISQIASLQEQKRLLEEKTRKELARINEALTNVDVLAEEVLKEINNATNIAGLNNNRLSKSADMRRKRFR